jgi:8-oxo-dGTP pyrophosphatase MutT (NUDIX family)
VGVATRAEMRAANLWHRTTFVAVLTAADEVVAHRRADWKDVWPSHWDLCFGGVVGAGEGWEAAAVRELAEEAGVAVSPEDLRLLAEGCFEQDQVRERYRCYVVRADGPFTFADGEVTAVEHVPRASLRDWCGGRQVVPDSVEIVVEPLLALEPD